MSLNKKFCRSYHKCARVSECLRAPSEHELRLIEEDPEKVTWITRCPNFIRRPSLARYLDRALERRGDEEGFSIRDVIREYREKYAPRKGDPDND